MIFLAVIAIVSNYAPTNQDTIQSLFDRINCPMPAISGLVNVTGTITYSDATYNWRNGGGGTGAQPPATLTCTEVHTIEDFDYLYGQPTLPFAGFGFFIGDWISELLANKLPAFFEMLGFLLSPASLNILGFTISDLSGFALMGVIAIYLMCYIAIGAMMYKIISPFAGAS